ncbi:MAG: sigma-54-dependent Fis family transcriptional regulator, partial [Calditrichaeota bacterium]
LLESSLFGHTKGAFTGAHADKIGYFQATKGGTLFLDEIGDLSLRAQAKILRVIEYGEVTPVGSVESEKVDVRLLAATHRDLKKLVEEGRFREDLYYRLTGLNLHLPPLREHPEDIPLLARHFLDKFCRENALPPKRLTSDAEAFLKIQPWPGNVRELLHFMGRVAVFAETQTISSDLILKVLRFDANKLSPTAEIPTLQTLHEARESFEREYILAALQRYNFNKSRAASALGIKRSQLYRKMEKLKIQNMNMHHASLEVNELEPNF